MAATRTSKARSTRQADKGGASDRPLAERYAEFQAELAGMQADAEARRQKAASEHQQKVHDDTHKAYAPAREAYLAYLGAYHSAATEPGGETAPDVAAAEFAYLEAHRQATEEAQRLADEHGKAHAQVQHKVAEDLQTSWIAACAAFVALAKASTADLDPETADPREVMALGQILVLAATSAMSARPPKGGGGEQWN